MENSQAIPCTNCSPAGESFLDLQVTDTAIVYTKRSMSRLGAQSSITFRFDYAGNEKWHLGAADCSQVCTGEDSTCIPVTGIHLDATQLLPVVDLDMFNSYVADPFMMAVEYRKKQASDIKDFVYSELAGYPDNMVLEREDRKEYVLEWMFLFEKHPDALACKKLLTAPIGKLRAIGGGLVIPVEILNYVGPDKFNRYLVHMPPEFVKVDTINGDIPMFEALYPCTVQVYNFNDKNKKWDAVTNCKFNSMDEIAAYINSLNSRQ